MRNLQNWWFLINSLTKLKTNRDGSQERYSRKASKQECTKREQSSYIRGSEYVVLQKLNFSMTFYLYF